MFGRNGESPAAVLAASSPSDCFEVAVEAARIALTYRTPVMLLSDGAIANGSEPWRIPDVGTFEPIETNTPTGREVISRRMPATRRPWLRQLAVPGKRRTGAPHRRYGEGRTAPATSPTIRTTTTGWSGCGRCQDRRHRRCQTSRSTTRPETPDCSSSAGAARSARSARPAAGPAAVASRWRTPSCPPQSVSPANLGDMLRRYPGGARMNLGQLALLRAALPGGRASRSPRSGMAFLADELPSSTRTSTGRHDIEADKGEVRPTDGVGHDRGVDAGAGASA